MKIETFIASELPQMKSKRKREKVSKNPVEFTGIIPMTNTRQCFHSVPELWETCASIHLICSCLRQKGVKDWYSKYKPESRKKQQRKRNWEQMWHAHNLLPQNTMVNGIFVFMLIFFSWLTRSFLMKEYNVPANVRQFDTILMTNVIRFSYKKEKKKKMFLSHSSTNAFDWIVRTSGWACLCACFIKLCIYQIDCQKISHWMNTSLSMKTKDRRWHSFQQKYTTKSYRTTFEYLFWCQMEKENIYVSTCFKVNNANTVVVYEKKCIFTWTCALCVCAKFKTEKTWRLFFVKFNF